MTKRARMRRTAPQISDPTMPLQPYRLAVSGLFGMLNHTVPFPLPSAEGGHPLLVILHGRNGIGKTTLLRMLDGMVRLDFNIFRRVPFSACSLSFTSGDSLSVRSKGRQRLIALEVSFRQHTVPLHPERSGPLSDRYVLAVEAFREEFFAATESLKFEFIHTARRAQMTEPDVADPVAAYFTAAHHGPRVVRSAPSAGTPPDNPKARDRGPARRLSERVAAFIRDAQVNYRTFFAATEPDLFGRLIDRLATSTTIDIESRDLKKRLAAIRDQDEKPGGWGLSLITGITIISSRSSIYSLPRPMTHGAKGQLFWLPM